MKLSNPKNEEKHYSQEEKLYENIDYKDLIFEELDKNLKNNKINDNSTLLQIINNQINLINNMKIETNTMKCEVYIALLNYLDIGFK
jgi:hemerythrin